MEPSVVAHALEQEKNDSMAEMTALLKTQSPQALARRDLAMINLVVTGTTTGYGGRTVLELGNDPAISRPEHWNPCFRVGDIVRVDVQSTSKPGKQSKSRTSAKSATGSTPNSDISSSRDAALSAIVVKVDRQTISVASEKDDEDSLPDLSGRLWLVKLENEAVYKRMRWAIDRMAQDPSGLVTQLMQGKSTASVQLDPDLLINSGLNEPQQRAVRHALGSNLAIIHGPPGTGKTKTVVEVILQCVRRGEHVLVCAPSNVAVDNIVERLSPHMERRELVRLGHPARLSEVVLRHSVDLLAKSSNEGQVIRDLQQEITSTLGTALGRTKGTRTGDRRTAFKLLKDLRRDYRSREGTLMETLLRGAKVVAATLHTAGGKDVGAVTPLFDTLVIDEVSQALLPQCWIPAVIDPGFGRLVVAGDNKQLPPTVASKRASVRQILEKTLFDVLVDAHGSAVKHLISIQYRMNQDIMSFPSEAIYDGKLLADASVADQSLWELPHVKRSSVTESKVLWIDTMTGYYPEQREEAGVSVQNEGEASLVKEYVNKLIEDGVKATDIGVIAPYNAQVGILRTKLPSQIEIASVDGFQGREKEVIILTLVRSNDDGNVGFVADERRINVAITRPKRQLCIIGNSETVGQHGLLKKWVSWVSDHADLEYAD